MAPSTSTPVPPHPLLLLVDDNAIVRGAAHASLQQAGFRILEAGGGRQALALATQQPPDAVVLDVDMPDLDGFSTCRQLLSLPGMADTPVVMLTGMSDLVAIDQSYAAGAVDFLTKPVQWPLLVYRVRQALRASAERAELARSRQRLMRAQRLARMGTWQITPQGELQCTPELAALFGGTAEQANCATADEFLSRVAPADRDRVASARAAALRDGQPYQLSFEVERYDGQRRTMSEHAAPLLDAQGTVVALEGIAQDVTERIEAERALQQLARYDSLTSLPNRPFFLELCTNVLERTRQQGQLCAYLHLDIDQFKNVNDALGRNGGDAVLRTVAQRLQSGIRRADLGGLVLSPAADAGGGGDQLVARIGANAFTLLLTDIGQPAHAASAAERLIREVQKPIAVGEREVVLSAGVGIALFPRDGCSPAELAAHAEQALYAAKHDGRSQHRFYDEQLNIVARERLAREVELRQAIACNQLRLHFQPKVDAAAGTIVGVEALVRWQHPQRGLVMPGEFIALAEETGLIAPLTDWVLEAACATLHRWLLAGGPPLTVSVNVASPLFMAEGLVGQLDALVARHDVPPQLLMVEVTESMLMADTEAAIARLNQLREHGFKLSLDDFGTGFSSLSYVKRFPLDELKIDRAFVRDVQRGGRDVALVASIITLARLLDLQVVAEGVETPEQAAILRELGCSLHQGFLYARPAPAGQHAPELASHVAAALASQATAPAFEAPKASAA